MKKAKLIPPDRKRCQAEIPTQVSFMTLGGVSGRVRCDERPSVVIRETKRGGGSMSLCDSCLAQFSRQVGMRGYSTEPICRDAKVGK